MQDRFKFRAYFIPEEYYVKITQLNFDVESNITKIKFIKPKSVDPEGSEYICYQDQLNKFVFEQCTGLRDKNGKTIYEGDIVETHDYTTEHSQIVFDKGCYVLKSKDVAIYDHLSSYEKQCEIIGNIHENPELLEEE